MREVVFKVCETCSLRTIVDLVKMKDVSCPLLENFRTWNLVGLPRRHLVHGLRRM